MSVWPHARQRARQYGTDLNKLPRAIISWHTDKAKESSTTFKFLDIQGYHHAPSPVQRVHLALPSSDVKRVKDVLDPSRSRGMRHGYLVLDNIAY
jgi:hypothetical protein